MKTIALGFSCPIKPSLFAKAVMWVDKTPYDHVYVRWTWSTIERDIIYQASKLAVNFESNITFLTHAIPVEEYEIQLDDQTHKDIMQFCMDNSDKPYGILQIIGFAYIKICKKLGYSVNNPFPSYGSTFICSKTGAAILALSGTVKIDVPLDNIDPLDLNNIVKAAGLKRIL